jgi:hypothetical protein
MADEMIKKDESLPAFIPQGSTVGTEHLTKEDIQMPRLGLAQALSPQLEEGNSKYIEGLKQGDMFNNLTNEIYGKGPIEFVIVRADPPRGIEFKPLDEGGGIVDFSVPLDDPRMKWQGQEKPIATKFYDYVIVMLPSSEVIALSFKGTGIKTAMRLNGLIHLRRTPLYAGKYSIQSIKDKSGEFTFYSFAVSNAGVVQEETTYRFCEDIFESIKGKPLDIERTPDSEADAPPIDVESKDVPF